jgi:dTDP-4-amino-4,6-dideoxygalactose transaminase
MWRCATTRTRAIFPIHYAGVACEMDEIMAIAKRHNLLVVEDAAQGVFAQYKGRWLGAIGHMGCYSFHETKNFSCGEGGALVINDAVFEARAEILREKRTNRSQFLRGQVDKYTWVDIGSSYVLSDMLAAFLLGQLENAEKISIRRGEIFHRYAARLAPLVEKGLIRGPIVPQHCATNHHIFYVLTADMDERAALIARLRQAGILAVFHYVPLHSSPFAKSLCLPEISLPVTDDTARRLLRLPIYYDLNDREVDQVVGAIFDFYVGRGRARVEPSAGGRVVWGERGQRQLELARRADFQYHPATS